MNGNEPEKPAETKKTAVIGVKICVTCLYFRECWCAKLEQFVCAMKGKECEFYEPHHD